MSRMKSTKLFSLNRVTVFFATLFITVLLTSCFEERLIEPDIRNLTGPAKVKIHVAIPDMQTVPVGTRAAEIISMYVMTFDQATGEMTDVPHEASIESITGTPPNEIYQAFVTTLNQSATPRIVWVVVNCEEAIIEYATTWGWVEAGSGGTPTMLAHVEANLKAQLSDTKILGSTIYLTEQPDVGPMSGMVTVPQIEKDMIITGSGNTPVALTRSVAKFTVITDPLQTPPVSDFDILGVSLGNAPMDGFILPQSPIQAATTIHHYADVSSTNEGAGYVTLVGAVDNRTSEELFCYEDSKTHQLFVILYATYKGVNGYYRIDIVDGDPTDDPLNRQFMDIVRNTSYTITITKVNNRGYSTLIEAINNPASNLEYSVKAYVPSIDVQDDAHDIISNGRYFLGVSNSFFYAYSDENTLFEEVATTLTHNAGSTVTTATITISGTGLGLIASTGVTLIGAAPASSATFLVGSTDKIPIKIQMSSAFKYKDSGGSDNVGEITITLGDLVKKIYIYRKPPLTYMQGLISEFAKNTVISGLPTTYGSWLRFSAKPDGSDAVEELTITNLPSNGVYVVYPDNIKLLGAAQRTSAAYFAQTNDLGRIKAVFIQGYLNIDEIVDMRLEPSYAGAFWRSDQRGERMIRIPVGIITGNLGVWRAEVVWLDSRWNAAMGDGVLLSLDGFSSGELLTRSISYSSALTPNDAEDFKINTGSLSVGGTVNSGDYIEFRIGPQKIYTPNMIYAARYGVVLLTYGNPAKTLKIYLRQGHDPDYLMRPEDTNGSGSGWGSPYPRPDAQKFSPYNLTAETLNAAVLTQVDAKDPGIAGNRSKFADFPSKAGAFFQWANNGSRTRYAWDAFSSGTMSGYETNAPNTYWTDVTNLFMIHETCPPGYRRPTDGATDAPNTSGNIVNSEIRQSLFLDPWNGDTGYTTNSDNIVQGYYADGFFDRRAITNGAGATTPGTNSSVSANDSEIAHWGYLFYNPKNQASLFFPRAGWRYSLNGELTDSGNSGWYWTSSSSSFQEGWNMNLTNAASMIFLLKTIRPFGFSIRCVADIAVTGVTLDRTPPTGDVSIGGTIQLTATVAPPEATSVRYEWQYQDINGDWQILATTMVNTYVAPVLLIGNNNYRVKAYNGSGDATSNIVIVNGLNLSGVEPEPHVLTYVGAFWRWSQTGERVIRIAIDPAFPEDAGPWTATVSWLDANWNIGAGDGVALSKALPSQSVLYTASPGNAESFQVYPGSDSTTISGYANPGEYITFRIGLKSQFSTYNAVSNPARYGVVLLSYGQGKWRRLFIRQGEGDDYVMRPGDKDGIGNAVGGAEDRSFAKKFSPYNIKDNQNRYVLPQYNVNQNAQLYFSNTNRGVWVDYPTMAGYLFCFNHTLGGSGGPHPVGTTFFGPAPITGASAQPVTTSWAVYYFWNQEPAEACPVGWRRPSDGSISAAGAGTVAGSEIRQSLWLNPQNNNSIPIAVPYDSPSNADNSVGGIYADGYYDRGIIDYSTGAVTPAGGLYTVRWNYYTGSYPPASNEYRVFLASSGRLFFNPETNASLFFPAIGISEASNSLDITAIGERGGYWTRTAYTTTANAGQASFLDFTIWNGQQSGVEVKMDGVIGASFMTVRCVVE